MNSVSENSGARRNLQCMESHQRELEKEHSTVLSKENEMATLMARLKATKKASPMEGLFLPP